MVGCGPQEQFRACADISIGMGAASPPLRPMRPVTKPTKGSYITKVPVTQPDSTEEVSDTSSRYVGMLIAFLTLLFVLCCMVVLYFYHYHGERIKNMLRWSRDKSDVSTTNSTTTLHCDSNYSMNLNLSAPVPPPRTKRLSSHLPEISASDANVLSGAEKGQF